MSKEKIELEYIINASNKIIFNCLSTPSGLSEWFAEDVNIRDDVYTFIWNGSEEQARLLYIRKDELIRFKWLEDEDEESFFELRIKIDSLTQEVALIVTDFAEPEDRDDTERLWENQVEALKHILGS